MKVSIIAIDLAKNVFQVAALNRGGKVVMNRSVRRARLVDVVRQFEPTILAMEACGSSHYWGRVFRRMGHDVRLVPPQHVKPFTRVNKTDAGDALAICEAARRPEMRFVTVKSIPQQDLRLISRQRTRLVRLRTATANQIRGIAREYGVFFSKGYRTLLKELPAALEDPDNELSMIARQTLSELQQELYQLDEKIKQLREQLQALTRPMESCQRLQQVPGFGPLVSAAFISAVADGQQFRNGRQSAAWLGLVPRMSGSGGKIRNLSITKNGDRELRALLIHGARAVVRWADRRDDPMGRWIQQLKARRGTNKTVVALANKMARIAWVITARGEHFDMNKAFG
jgi:transposase